MTKVITFFSQYDSSGSGSTRYWLMKAGLVEVANAKDADIIVFNGGADIGTSIYGETPVFGGIPILPSQRDRVEMDVYDLFREDKSKFFLGICRGAQLLNCLNGGTLWQHVDNHGSDHKMLDQKTGLTYDITSTHHQMMRPSTENGGEVIGVSSESRNKYAQAATVNGEKTEDIEIVWYPATRTLCVQGHPEYVPGSKWANYILDMVRAYMKDTVVCAA